MANEPLLPVVDADISNVLVQEVTEIGVQAFVKKYVDIIEEENPGIHELIFVMAKGEPDEVRSLLYVAMIGQYVALRSQAEADRISAMFKDQ